MLSPKTNSGFPHISNIHSLPACFIFYYAQKWKYYCFLAFLVFNKLINIMSLRFPSRENEV